MLSGTRARIGVFETYKKFGPKFGAVFSLYDEILSTDTPKVSFFRSEIQKIKVASEKDLIIVLKNISDYAMKKRFLYNEYWYFMVDLDVQGSPEDATFETMAEMAYQWTGVPDKVKSDSWYTDIPRMLDEVFVNRKKVLLEQDDLTIEQFVNKPNLYMSHGSASKTMIVGGKRYRTKASVLIAEGQAEILDHILSLTNLIPESAIEDPSKLSGVKYPKSRSRVFQKKDEKGTKLRLIINGDVPHYLIMCYVSTVIEKYLFPVKQSPYLNSNSELVARRQRTFRNLLKGMNFPIDQKEFDHHVDPKTIKIIFIWFLNYLKSLKASNIMLKCMCCLICYVDNIIIQLKEGVMYREWAYTNGLLSGWRWTAMLGTIVNMLENYYANSKVNILEWDDCSMLGDDADLKIKEGIGLYAVFLYCLVLTNELHLVIHPRKNFWAKDFTTFLRHCYIHQLGAIIAMPGRMLSSLIWSKDYLSIITISSAVSNWLKIFRRCRVFNYPLMYKDIYQMLITRYKNIPKNINPDDLLKSWLGASCVIGGCGIKEYSQFYCGLLLTEKITPEPYSAHVLERWPNVYTQEVLKHIIEKNVMGSIFMGQPKMELVIEKRNYCYALDDFIYDKSCIQKTYLSTVKLKKEYSSFFYRPAIFKLDRSYFSKGYDIVQKLGNMCTRGLATALIFNELSYSFYDPNFDNSEVSAVAEGFIGAAMIICRKSIVGRLIDFLDVGAVMLCMQPLIEICLREMIPTYI